MKYLALLLTAYIVLQVYTGFKMIDSVQDNLADRHYAMQAAGE